MSGMWCNNLNLANGGTLISTTLSFLSDNKLGGERERERETLDNGPRCCGQLTV